MKRKPGIKVFLKIVSISKTPYFTLFNALIAVFG